jgi:serine/threonine-protein kinase
LERLEVEFRYRVSYPLEHRRHTAVYAVTDRWESDRKKVLTLLNVPPIDKIPADQQAQLGRDFEQRHCLRHPLLPRVWDLAARGNRLGVISSFIEGKPFSTQLPLVTAQTQLEIAFDLVQLLTFLHERDFLIGYLDPSKLFWNSQDRILVNLLLKEQGFRAGTSSNDQRVRYWTPEYLLDREASREADVYSLGMNLYFLFTGRPPFSESDPGILAQKQMVAEPVPPQRLNSSIPNRLDNLVRSMTQKRHNARPSTSEVLTFLTEETAIRSIQRSPGED